MSEQNYANVQQQAELMKYISDNMKIPVLGAGGGFAPIGTLNFYDGILAPQGWLICDGTVYNIADYPELASHYASHHGASNFYGGDGVTTFAVPDLRGEFLRMIGTNSHTNQGDGGTLGQHQDGTSLPFLYKYNANINSGNAQTYEKTSRTADKVYGNVSQFSHVDGTSGTATVPMYVIPRPTNTSFLIIVKATVSGDANAHQYSTEEQVIGKDEDGNDIYERVIKGTTPSTAETPETIESVSGINLLSVYGMIDGRYPIGYSYPNQSTGPQYISTIYINGIKTQLLICVDNALTSKSYRAVIQYTKTQ